MLSRFIFFAFIGYILLTIIKFLIKAFTAPPKNPKVNDGNSRTVKQQSENQFDKSKAVDADFEELK
ncbi:MAG: hypothetical protein NTV87_00865 [Ignavibacteriae bacterium]|jgi:hypothetical protein|nr:hypothetical protein [Ignavibacteriota bacterium]